MKKLLLALLFLLSCSPCYADYSITETELTQLETNLKRLEVLNNQSQRELTQLQDQLETAENQLCELKAMNQKQQDSLEKANESLRRYAAEEKRKRRILKLQRAGAWSVAFVAILVAAL